MNVFFFIDSIVGKLELEDPLESPKSSISSGECDCDSCNGGSIPKLNNILVCSKEECLCLGSRCTWDDLDENIPL